MSEICMAVAIYGFHQRDKAVEPAGISYEYLKIKDKLALGLPTLPVLNDLIVNKLDNNDSCKPDENLLDLDDKKYRKYISGLDPSEWKKQDHYRILGLSKLRYKATQDQIKYAYRRKVLKYHPDKGTENLKSEAIFACIQKAYEQVGDTDEKKRAYDSVDPTFDENIPSSIDNNCFYATFHPVFDRNSRYSHIQPVPQIGDESCDRDYVENFYEFWFNWKSWREFSYLDEEDKSKGGDRWERREIEKQNKIEREKRRKADLKRISSLVQTSYDNDPRIAKFKELERQNKESLKERKRKEREEKEEMRRKAEQDELEQIEAEKKKQREIEKRAKQIESQKKAILFARRKKLREAASSAYYWTEDHDQKLHIMEQIERICIDASQEEIDRVLTELPEFISYDQALKQLAECAKRQGNSAGAKLFSKNCDSAKTCSIWSPAELNALIKATTVYQVGTTERWSKVAKYIVDHVPGSVQRMEKEAKQLKALNQDSETAMQVKSCHVLPFQQQSTTLTTQQPNKPINNNDWSVEQQRQFEAALKNTSSSDPLRWEKIADLVDRKTKKDCVKRYKYLAEMVKAARGPNDNS